MADSSSVGETIELSRFGISLSYIVDEFLDIECTGIPGVDLKTATTGLIYEKIIQPKSLNLSLCETWKHSNADRIGPATVFISHCWNRKFTDTVNALKLHFRETPDIFIWMDIFSYNCDSDETMEEFDSWCGGLRNLISGMSRLVLIMPSFTDMVPLRRLWCIFELYLAVDVNASFDLAMLDVDVEQVLESIRDDSRYLLTQIMDVVSVTHSRCTRQEDYSRLCGVILTSPTAERDFCSTVVRAVCRCLVEFTKNKLFELQMAIEKTTAAADSLAEATKTKLASMELEHSFFNRGVGTLLMSTGRCSEAAAYIKLSLDHQVRVMDQYDTELMKSQTIQCGLFYERQEYEKADQLCRKIIAVLKKNVDVRPRNFIDVMSLLARTLEAQQRTKEADKLYRACDFICGKYLLEYSYYNAIS